MKSFGLFKNFSNKALVLMMITAILICIAVGYVHVMLDVFETDTIFLVTATISMIVFFSVTSEFTSRMVLKRLAAKRANPKVYKLDDFSYITSSLKESNAIVTKFDFGANYLLIKDDVAYRVCVVNDYKLYFNRQTSDKGSKKNDNMLDKCTKFYGFEIFESIDESMIQKVELFSFQSEKICYAGMYYNNKQLIQASYEEPLECHKDNYNYLIKLIGAVENEVN